MIGAFINQNQATIWVLLWCLILSLCLSLFSWWLLLRRQERRRELPVQAGISLPMPAPALVLAPLLLVAAFACFNINLIFPVSLLAGTTRMFFAALAPAVVLFLASGLAGALVRSQSAAYSRWRARPFAVFAQSLGSRPERAIRRVVLLESWLTAWTAALPWLFGELIVVEVVFNAPGLGSAAWLAARERDFPALLTNLGVLLVLYTLLSGGKKLFHQELGKKLQGYA